MSGQAQYRIIHPWWNGSNLVKPSPRRAGSDVIAVPAGKVPSITWFPLNDVAERDYAKLKAEVEERKAAQAVVDRMKDPTFLLQQLVLQGKNPEQAIQDLAAAKALKAKEAELAEMKAELEGLKARQEPPAQGVVGADVKASPKK